MYDTFVDLASRPECFSIITAKQLWTDPHVSEQMLRFHLDPSSPLASRPPDQIDLTVAWLDDLLTLEGKRVVDLGCGPGLYAERFHDRGAIVTGLDWSARSLEHADRAAAAAGRTITYRLADYTTDPLPRGTDLFTLIYCDFCALSPEQRHGLLLRMREALAPGGRLAMDIQAIPAFEGFRETTLIERRMMDGFWSNADYVGVRKSFRYTNEFVTLDRYLIVTPSRHWSIYNWLQYFSPSSLAEELTAAGFEIEHLSSGLSGEQLSADSEQIGVVARAL